MKLTPQILSLALPLSVAACRKSEPATTTTSAASPNTAATPAPSPSAANSVGPAKGLTKENAKTTTGASGSEAEFNNLWKSKDLRVTISGEAATAETVHDHRPIVVRGTIKRP